MNFVIRLILMRKYMICDPIKRVYLRNIDAYQFVHVGSYLIDTNSLLIANNEISISTRIQHYITGIHNIIPSLVYTIKIKDE